MKYISVCSGIEAASVAWGPLGWEPVAFAEIEAFPSAVLAHHYPDVPNLGDMTKIDGRQYHGKVDILVGGTPCQAFSIAGLRKGLEDARGNLTLTFVELADAIQPPFVLWENVPGVLSSNDNAFGCFLGGLSGTDGPLLPPGGRWTDAGCVFGPRRSIAWRVLDAQYFGVAQRRRRVFVVACPRGGADPTEILFEWQGQRRDTAPRQAATRFPCLTRTGGYALDDRTPYVLENAGVRVATPLEWERAQGFPDGHTDIPWKGKEHAPDGPRYKALGNSMAVPCMRWVGERIKKVEDA